MEVSGQLHDPTTLLLGKQPTLPIVQESRYEFLNQITLYGESGKLRQNFYIVFLDGYVKISTKSGTQTLHVMDLEILVDNILKRWHLMISAMDNGQA